MPENPRICMILFTAVLMASCGTAGRTVDGHWGTLPERVEPIHQADSTERPDSFVPLHPPVVVPHIWRDAM